MGLRCSGESRPAEHPPPAGYATNIARPATPPTAGIFERGYPARYRAPTPKQKPMKISGTYVLALPQDRAYQLLQDPDVLARCMPGCEALVRIAENEFQIKMKMVLASFSGLFDGTVKIVEPEPSSSFRLIVEGKGKIGFMKGDGRLHLTPEGTDTQVAYEGDVQVGGTLAAVGQRLVDSTARMMIKRFFDRLSEANENIPQNS